jgi:glucosyl-dolichyl phosphate glucuronosyltransferase
VKNLSLKEVGKKKIMNVRISAVICTFNRANYLPKAIQSLVEQSLDASLYEILVVDNCSTDNTKQIVTETFADVGNLRYVYEPILGVAQARNAGWQNAKGEFVAYLDDDAIASPYWLEKILEVFDTVTPQPACVGGRVNPIWEAEKPDWLPKSLEGLYAIVDYGDRPLVLQQNQFFVATNSALPRQILAKMANFNVGLGRKGNNLLSMEENLLQDELRKQGYQLYYHPEIAIAHHIHANRIDPSWMLSRVYWEGISAAIYQIYRESPSNLKRLRLALSKTKKLFKSPVSLISLLQTPHDPQRFQIKCSALMQIGYIAGIVGIVK